MLPEFVISARSTPAEEYSQCRKTVCTDVDAVLRRMEAKINDIKFDLVKWIAGMLLAQAGLVAALVKLL